MAESIKTLATEKHAESRELSILRLGVLFCNYIFTTVVITCILIL